MRNKKRNKNSNVRNKVSAIMILTVLAVSLSDTSNAGELYIGQFTEKSEHVTYKQKLRDSYPPNCFSGDWNYRYCQRAIGQWHEVESKNRYLIAYSHQGYTAGLYNNEHGEDAGFAEKKFTLAELYDFEFSIGAGVTYSELNDIEVYAAPEISYTRYKVKPAVLVLNESVALSVKISI